MKKVIKALSKVNKKSVKNVVCLYNLMSARKIWWIFALTFLLTVCYEKCQFLTQNCQSVLVTDSYGQLVRFKTLGNILPSILWIKISKYWCAGMKL